MAKKGFFSQFVKSPEELLEKPESIFKKNLFCNPVYPFEEYDPKVYVHTVQFGSFYISVFMAVLVIVITTVSSIILGYVNEYLIFALLIFFGFVYQCVSSYKTRTYILDSNTCLYEFYRGNELIYCGDYHNVYIRLKAVKSGGGRVFYSVVLNGYKIDEENITPATEEKKELVKCAKRLAKALNINYFDSDDISKDHIIIHRCPYIIYPLR